MHIGALSAKKMAVVNIQILNKYNGISQNHPVCPITTHRNYARYVRV